VSGAPTVIRIWHFNNQPLQMSNTIIDLESPWSARDLYVQEGMDISHYSQNSEFITIIMP